MVVLTLDFLQCRGREGERGKGGREEIEKEVNVHAQ